jgi:hypothetical protein
MRTSPGNANIRRKPLSTKIIFNKHISVRQRTGGIRRFKLQIAGRFHLFGAPLERHEVLWQHRQRCIGRHCATFRALVQHHFTPAGKANKSSSTSKRPYPEVRIVEHEGVGRPFAVETAADEVAAAESVRATAKKDASRALLHWTTTWTMLRVT